MNKITLETTNALRRAQGRTSRQKDQPVKVSRLGIILVQSKPQKNMQAHPQGTEQRGSEKRES